MIAHNLVPEIIEFIIKYLSIFLGKGYGGHSINNELRHAKYIFRKIGVSPTVCVDIGANVGDYTAALVKAFPGSTIHTFDASEHCFKKLHHRFKDNSKIIIHTTAISDVSGSISLYSDAPESGLASTFRRELSYLNIQFDHVEPTRSRRFDDVWMEELSGVDIDLIKLDIEGGEHAAMQFMEAALASTTVLQFEFGGANIDSRTYFKDIWDLLANHNFSLYRISPIGLIPVRKYSTSLEYFDTTNYFAVNRRRANGLR